MRHLLVLTAVSCFLTACGDRGAQTFSSAGSLPSSHTQQQLQALLEENCGTSEEECVVTMQRYGGAWTYVAFRKVNAQGAMQTHEGVYLPNGPFYAFTLPDECFRASNTRRCRVTSLDATHFTKVNAAIDRYLTAFKI